MAFWMPILVSVAGGAVNSYLHADRSKGWKSILKTAGTGALIAGISAFVPSPTQPVKEPK